MKARRVIPAVLAGAALAVSVPLAWMGSTPFTHACDDVSAYVQEGADLGSSTSIWPPGVDCTSSIRGAEITYDTYVTWYELSLALLFGAGVYLVVATALGSLPPARLAKGLGLLALLFLVATAIFFI